MKIDRFKLAAAFLGGGAFITGLFLILVMR